MKHELSKERLELLANHKLECTTFSNQERAAMARALLAGMEQEPVMYVKAGEDFDTEAISTCKSVVDAWVEEWNAVGEPVYKTVQLYTHPAPIPACPQRAGTGRMHKPGEEPGDCAMCHGTGLSVIPYIPASAPSNSFTDADLAGMAHGDNPVANAYRELLAYRRTSPVIPGWIPVSERMPLTPFADCEYSDIEVCAFDGERVLTAHYAIGSLPYPWGDWVDTAANITHWQPLPNPPKDDL